MIRQLDNTPPHDAEAEQALLGSIILKPELLDDLADVVDPSDFYDDAHGTLCESLRNIHQAGRKVDVAILLDELRKSGQLDAIGGPGAIARIAQAVPNAAHAQYYAEIVRDKSILRELRNAGQTLAELSHDAGDPLDALAQAESTIGRIGERHARREHVTDAKALMAATLQTIQRRVDGTTDDTLPTGFSDLDRMLGGGMRSGELVIVAGRPSMGKTALATNLVENVAIRQQRPALLVSLEMGAEQLGDRILSSQSKVPLTRILDGTLTMQQRGDIQEAAATIANSGLLIDDAPSRTLHQIAALARRMHRQRKLAIVAIDYIGLVRPANARDPRQEQVATISRGLKALARELGVPVVCLSQLNRATEDTREARPRLHNLRESGAIEQDADVVIFVHRPEYYATGQERVNLAGQAVAIVAKQRNGPTGDVDLVWRKDFARFESKARHDEPEPERFDFGADYQWQAVKTRWTRQPPTRKPFDLQRPNQDNAEW